MKKIVIILCVLVFPIVMQAQDTIYPMNMDISIPFPFLRDSSYRLTMIETRHEYTQIERFAMTTAFDFPDTMLTGLRVAMSFRDMNKEDVIELRGVVIQVIGDDYNNPIVHFTNPLMASKHFPPDHYMVFNRDSDSLCRVGTWFTDSIVDAYSLYFDHPLQVSGTTYVGMYTVRKYRSHGFYTAGNIIYYSFSNCATTEIFSLLHYYGDSSDVLYIPTTGAFAVSEPYYCPHSQHIIFPIYDLPDTDSFSCPEVGGFSFAGINAGYPTFVWDTAEEHTVYQLAYGAYDTPLDSLTVVETDNWYHELITTLSPDVYYQARLRAKCHHQCPLHDTVMWTPWTDPVYFYTGDHMPDTTHHGEPEGIAGAEGQASFTLAPNPARGSVTLTLTGMPAQGTTLTLYDAAGREVLRRTLSEQRTTIPTAELPAGVYTVTVTGPQGTGTRRLSVE